MGLPDLDPATGADKNNIQEMQRACARISSGLQAGEPVPGAVAAVFRGAVMVHVGLVVEIEGRLAVIETNPVSGVRWSFLPRFLATYYKVIFYRDRDFPEPT